MLKAPLTTRQFEVLTKIVEHYVAFFRAPTIRELGQYLRISSTNGVFAHLRALARKGAIVRRRDTARGIEVDWDEARALGLPYPIWNFPVVQSEVETDAHRAHL